MKKFDKSPPSPLADPWLYFAATFIWTWIFWSVAIALGVNMASPLGFGLLIAGVSGPLVTGVGFTYLTKNKAGRRDYWRRVIDPRTISAKWFLVIVLFAPALFGLAALLDFTFGGTGAVWGETLLNAATNPLGLVFSAMFATLIPFIEELGWRGYVLDRLQAKRSAFTASFIIGVVWSLWHLPLFFVEGTYQAGLGVGTLEFWLFMVGVVFLSFPFTWVYNNTQRSILAVILFHGVVNFAGELIPISERADTISTFLWLAAAAGITLFWGHKAFTRHPALETAGEPLRRKSV